MASKCGCDRRAEKLLYWLGWRRWLVGPPASGSWVHETPEGTFILPNSKVREHHTRAALLGILVWLFYGTNEVEGPPIEFWTAENAEQEAHRWLRDHPTTTLVTSHTRPTPDAQWNCAVSWGALWYPVVRRRIEVVPPFTKELGGR
jgi:hypothetical protein